MMPYFRMNNEILDLGLTPNEIKVAVYLYSCVFKNCFAVQIKRSTIAEKCGIKREETVGSIVCKLQRKGIIERVKRPVSVQIYSRKTDRSTVENVSVCLSCCY